MSCITIRNCCIGEGKPNVIIPIVEHTEAAILQKAAEFSTLSADCVEWRVDLFELAKDLRAVAHDAAKLRVALKDKLLLVTFRTKGEGGSVALSREEYIRFIHTVLATDCADLIDIEFFTAGADLPGLIEDAHTAGVKVVCSSHDFHKTPPVITMSMGTLGAVSRLCGEAFGSAMTFANPGAASAPGQVPLDVVNEVLESLHAER